MSYIKHQTIVTKHVLSKHYHQDQMEEGTGPRATIEQLVSRKLQLREPTGITKDAENSTDWISAEALERDTSPTVL
jgi:hypothetical protein